MEETNTTVETSKPTVVRNRDGSKALVSTIKTTTTSSKTIINKQGKVISSESTSKSVTTKSVMTFNEKTGEIKSSVTHMSDSPIAGNEVGSVAQLMAEQIEFRGMEAIGFAIDTKDSRWFRDFNKMLAVPTKAKLDANQGLKEAAYALQETGSLMENKVKETEQAHMDSAFRAQKRLVNKLQDSLRSIMDKEE